nr:MAG TPA: hypothetical protein [Caudoviricetes sp.]
MQKINLAHGAFPWAFYIERSQLWLTKHKLHQ